jgi:hypothetical protein
LYWPPPWSNFCFQKYFQWCLDILQLGVVPLKEASEGFSSTRFWRFWMSRGGTHW